MNDKEALLKALLEALQNETVLDRIAEKVAQKVGGPAKEKPTLQSLWTEELAKAGLALAPETTPESLAKLYPLTPQEVKQTVERLKTSGREKPLALDDIGAEAAKLLGEDVLMGRLESRRRTVRGGPAPYRCAQAHAQCGPPHNCAQPYYCGPAFHCGAPYECGTPHEFWPCASSTEHCSQTQGYSDPT